MLFAATIACSVLCFGLLKANAQTPFFPGAEGFGGTFLGSAPAGGWFANAEVYHVTNLNEDGPGSFRNAFDEDTANKIIVFDVGGVIRLDGSGVDNIDIKNLKNYYIAGQTAPSPVTIYGDMTQITHSPNKVNENIILRYMTFRKGVSDNDDTITFAGGNDNGVATNMILDHVTSTWAEDENTSVANYNTNITVQNSLIADALDGGSDHAYGSLIRPRTDSQVSFHHNLYANNKSRQPRLGNYNDSLLTADLRNNVVYNFSDRAAYAGGSSGSVPESVDLNFVGNYTVAGPTTPSSNAPRTVQIDNNAVVEAYQAGNYVDSDKVRGIDGKPNGADTGWSQFYVIPSKTGQLTQRSTPFATPNVTTMNAPDAYDYVVSHAGNWWWDREAIDARIVGNVTGATNPPDGVSPLTPNAAELAALLATPMTTHAAGYDTDGDGMSTVWELAHGLDPTNPNDWNGDFDNDGYIDLVEFINEKGEFPAPAPIVFQGGGFPGSGNVRYAEFGNWRTDDSAATGGTGGTAWQPSRFDEVRIPSGSRAAIDAAGQHAGNLTLQHAFLDVDDGWLAVEGELAFNGNSGVMINGGQLLANRISSIGTRALALRGGTLRANEIAFGVTNSGSTLAPGLSLFGGIGTTTIDGYLELESGAIEVEIADAETSDTLVIDGLVTLGGALDVLFLDLYDPGAGSWDIMTATEGFSGAFDTLPSGFATGIVGSTLTLYYNTAVPLAGDYNGNGVVDAADFTVWRDGFENGEYTMAHYDTWVANFGMTAEPPVDTQSVPEPAALAMLGLLALGLTIRRGRP
ncbi:PEP-CTERM sorting domain-containing protein [Pseudobythopirellula maris]|uniref:PEP-CTERM sorting domain-containing protein n=1 Tax=Pseudobythopirellula maris TaxID=2527991 RepID=UPI0018D3FD32|nr:PEP-CTERM sorting domain-containing protein [Pseudobythopirellula maris]